MTEHDLAVLERVRAEPGSLAVEADDPAAVAAALAGAGDRVLAPDQLASWADEAAELRARADAVLAAEEVVVGAAAAEGMARAALLDDAGPAPAIAHADPGDHRGPADRRGHVDADRQAVRFALVILVPAQLAGIAVYLADRTLLAVVAPAVALAGVLAVAAAHRRPPPVPTSPERAPGGARPPGAGSPLVLGSPEHRLPGTAAAEVAGAVATAARPHAAPAVLAAQAHLRRRQAAWKLAWWQRGLAPVDVALWVGRPGEDVGERSTLVVTDPSGAVGDDELARTTAALPAAVRVVLVRGRPA